MDLHEPAAPVAPDINPAQQTVSAAVAAPRRAALIFIFITVMLDMLALGIMIPTLPKLVEQLLNGDTRRAALIYGNFGMVWATMQFLFMPVLGALSDRYGRRRVILLSNFGTGLDYIVMALAPTVGWLFVGRTASGITSASISTAYAYISDITAPEKRAGAFGMLGIAFGLGFTLGPTLGGELGHFDPRLPFWVAAGLSLGNAMYGLFVLPESLPPQLRAPFSWRRANPVGSLLLLRSHRHLLGLGSVIFLGNLAHMVLPSTTVLYMGYRYGWDGRDVARMLAGVGICSAIVQGGLIRPVIARFGERRALLTAQLFGAAGFMVYGLASTGTEFLIGIPIFALWGLATPSVQSLMSRQVGPSEQGRLQGANSSLMGIAAMIGPGLFSRTFAASIGTSTGWHLQGAAFVLAALLLLCGWGVAWRATR